MKRYIPFIGVSYGTAIFFEFIANTFGDGKLFSAQNWLLFFLGWYGLIYSVLYFIFSNRPVWMGVVFFAVFGSLMEILIFHRGNPIVDPVIYALMAFVPLGLNKRK